MTGDVTRPDVLVVPPAVAESTQLPITEPPVVLVETLRPVRSRYAELVADPAELDRRVARGAATAAALAAPTLAAVRAAMGVVDVGQAST
ncbi:MAG: hypothetical protein ACXV0U_01845 [Kineosporiaceae bacterium]